MADVTIAYKGSSIATMNASGSKTLQTKQKYCEDDITVTYVDPEKPTQSKTVTPTAAGLTVTPDTGKVLSSVVVNGDNNLVAGNVKSGVSIFGVSGSLTPAKTEQSKTVTPTAAGLTVTPDSGKVLSSVVVNGDSNLKAANVKSGVSIFGVTGSLASKETVTWFQDSIPVRSYIDTVNYTGVAYTSSSISTYAPSTPNPSANTKPIGKTVDGVTYYNEIPNKQTPFASTNVAGTLSPLDQVRWINSVTNNFRDIGGWACDGGTVKYGLIYRSGELHANDEDLIVNQLGIKTEVDLTADGTPAYGNKLRFVGYTSYAMYTLSNPGAWRTNLRGIFDAVLYGDPVVFHCSMGADRTGTLACILEAILGVSQSDCDKDYELTSFYTMRARNGNYQGGTADWAHLIEQINALSGSTFRDKAVSFVMSLGFSIAEINAFRAAMIDGTPETLNPTVTSYTVTKNYTDASGTNSASSVTQYSRYQNDITANADHVLSSASVTMGGTDITADVLKTTVSGGVVTDGTAVASIDIPSVTGNIVIDASAAAGARIPSAYQEVEWIGSDGNQTIRVSLNSTRVGAYIEHKIMRVGSGVRGLIGFAHTNATDIGAGAGSYFGWSTTGYWDMGGSSISTTVQAPTNSFALCKFECYASGSWKLSVDGSEVVSRAGSAQLDDYLVFGGASYKANCKQQECKVYNVTGGGTLTAHLIPCYRKSDGVIGMYDKVNNTFLENVGTGTFTKGSDV